MMFEQAVVITAAIHGLWLLCSGIVLLKTVIYTSGIRERAENLEKRIAALEEEAQERRKPIVIDEKLFGTHPPFNLSIPPGTISRLQGCADRVTDDPLEQ